MGNVRDAVVVGGGPAGSFFSCELAKRGFAVRFLRSMLRLVCRLIVRGI